MCKQYLGKVELINKIKAVLRSVQTDHNINVDL